jgi:hypothetical protein
MDLMKLAEEKLGKERALELHADIQQLAGDIEKLREEPLEVEDAP